MWEYICMHVLVFLKTFLDLCREPFPDLNELDSQEVETGLNSSFFHVIVCCENPNRCLKCVPATLRLCHISSFLIWLCCLRKKKRKEKKKRGIAVHASVTAQPWLQCHNALSMFTFSTTDQQ